jgi:hypothetical protein
MTDQRSNGTYQSTLATVGLWLDNLGAAHRQLESAHKEAKHEIGRLASRVADLQGQVRKLEDRFTNLLADEYDRRRPETPRAEDLGYYEIADQWREFFLDLREVARPLRPQAAPTERVRLVAQLAGASLTDDPPNAMTALLTELDAPRAIRNLGKDFAKRSREIHDRARELGRDFRWVVDGLDPSARTLWPGCSADDTVRFMVTPAFVVEGKVLLPAYVYTSPEDS